MGHRQSAPGVDGEALVRVLVTGHYGFVGKHLSRELTKGGHEVIGLDKRDIENLAELSDPIWVKRIREREPEVIVHLASSCSTLGSIRRPEDTFRDTVSTTVTVTQAAAELKVPLILTSSVKARDGMTPYGAAKRMAETWAAEMMRTFEFPLVINRPGTIYGPGQEGSLESGWIAWFLSATKVTINGDGSQMRDLLHVSDYVKLLVRQVEWPAPYWGRIWDVGGGIMNAVTVLQMAEYLGLSYEFGPERYGDAHEYIGINDAPGWEPEVYWKDAEVFSGYR